MGRRFVLVLLDVVGVVDVMGVMDVDVTGCLTVEIVLINVDVSDVST
tara:strand:+ start:328 stop:468 length:141 start_codon:yes stop_codon:yes gene_type:complete